MHYLLPLLLLLITLPARAGMPELPVPPDARVTNVTGETHILGMDLQARRFDVDKPLNWVLDFYRREWDTANSGRPGYMENDFGPWKMVTRLEDRWYFSVQAQSSGFSRTWGYVGVSDMSSLGKHERDLGSGFPMMNGSQVLNDMPSRDPGRKGRTLMMVNSFTVGANADYYRGYYAQRGWNVAMDSALKNGIDHLLLFKRPGADLTVSIQRIEKGSAIVANEVKY